MAGGLGMIAKLLAICALCAAAGLFYIGTYHLFPEPTTEPGLMQRHMHRIVVLGSGLAGTTAALAAADAAAGSAEVVVLEKEPRMGGNSMKASSGINALSPDQGDSAEAFREDTLRSGGGLSVPELVDTLVVRSRCPRCTHLPLVHAVHNQGLGFRVRLAALACRTLPKRDRPARPCGSPSLSAALRGCRATARRRCRGWSRRAWSFRGACSWGATAASAPTPARVGPWGLPS